MATETKEFPVYRRAVGFASMPYEVYQYLKENNGINEGTLYYIKENHQLYKGYDILTQQIETVDDATVEPEGARDNVLYVDPNGRLATMINGQWLVLTKGDTLTVSDTVIDKGVATASAVSGKAVKDFVNKSLNFVTDVYYEELPEQQEDGSVLEKYYLVINKNKAAGGTESRIDLTPFMDATPEEERIVDYAKPILPSNIYYITGAQSSIYTHNMFGDPDAADHNEVAIIAEDSEGEIEHTYLYDKFSSYIQNSTSGVFNNTIGTTDKYGHEYINDIIFHSNDITQASGYSAKVQFIGDSLFFQKGTNGKSVPGMFVKELAKDNIIITPIGTKADQESSNYWTLETAVGANTKIMALDKEVYVGGVKGSAPYETHNMFVRLATAADYTNTPKKCFCHTVGGAESEDNYTDSENKGTARFSIFDYQYYLNTYLASKPDIVVIGYGNELTPLSVNQVTGISEYNFDRAMTALEIMVDSIKDALPNAVIGIATPIAKARNVKKDLEWKKYTSKYIEALIDKVNSLQTKYSKLYLIPLYLHVDRNFNFSSDASKYTGNIDTKNNVYTQKDIDHLIAEGFQLTDQGRTEVVAALKGWLLEVISNK